MRNRKKKDLYKKENINIQGRNEMKQNSTLFESFKSGIGFSTGMEMVRGIGNSLLGNNSSSIKNNESNESNESNNICKLEREKFNKCIDEQYDIIECIDVLREFKLCKEKYL